MTPRISQRFSLDGPAKFGPVVIGTVPPVPTIELPRRERRRNETTITRAAIVALNRIPGVVATRNNVGKSPVACTYCRAKLCRGCAPRLSYPIPFGLAVGSSDIVGLYTAIVDGEPWPMPFGVEVKAPGATTKREHLEDQARWMRVMELRGMPCAMVTSARDAELRVLEMIGIFNGRLSRSRPQLATISPLDTRALRELVSRSRSTDSSSSPRSTRKSARGHGRSTKT